MLNSGYWGFRYPSIRILCSCGKLSITVARIITLYLPDSDGHSGKSNQKFWILRIQKCIIKAIMHEDTAKPLDIIGNTNLGTRPEIGANFEQNWELISFVSIGKTLQDYSAVSTAAVFAPAPFETFIPLSAKRGSNDLRVNGMETFIFDHGKVDNPESHYGKSQQMEVGCIDHFSSITQTVLSLSSYPTNLAKTLDQVLPNNFRIVTFIYKPIQDGWITVETIKQDGKTKTIIHSRANKAGEKEEVRDRETLYCDSDIGQEVESAEPRLKTHFRVICDEVEANIGHHGKLKPYNFGRESLKTHIGIKT